MIKNVSTKKEFSDVDAFFRHKEHFGRFIQVVNRTSQISLRLLDYFCVNYAKKHNVMYALQNGKPFNVHLSYKSQLKTRTKKRFDPFRRNDRTLLPSPRNNETHETTIGQLVFFKWCIEHEVLDYVEKNVLVINNEMKHCSGCSPRARKQVNKPTAAAAAGSRTRPANNNNADKQRCSSGKVTASVWSKRDGSDFLLLFG